MARNHIAFPLAFLLSVSPALSFFVPFICCCDNDLPGFHLRDGQHARQGQDHVEGHTPEASGRSPEHCHDLQQSSDSNQDSDSHSMVAASSVGASSSPCLCSAVDLHSRQDAALLSASETNRPFRNLASGHLASATQVSPKRLNAGTYAASTRDLRPAGPGLYVINHSFLI